MGNDHPLSHGSPNSNSSLQLQQGKAMDYQTDSISIHSRRKCEHVRLTYVQSTSQLLGHFIQRTESTNARDAFEDYT